MNCYSGKTVLITGATGLIGSHLVDTFMQMKDVHVIALSRSSKKLQEGFADYLSSPFFKILPQNISEEISGDLGTIDYIFHAASPMEGKIISNTPVDVIIPNLTGTINCLEFLRKQKQKEGITGRLILFSSVTVYGNISNEDICVEENETRVTDSLDSISAPYSQSKRMSEVIAKAYIRQYELDVVIARLSTVYGDVRFVPDTAFYEFITKAIKRENIILNSSNAPRRDNIFIHDAVSGLLCIAESGLRGEAYNISSNGDKDNYASVDEIATIISDIANRKEGKTISVYYKQKNSKKRNPGLKLNNKKLKALGWEITTSLSDGISKTLDSFQI